MEDRRRGLLTLLARHIRTSTDGAPATLVKDWRVFEIVSALSANERYGYAMVWDQLSPDVKDRIHLPYYRRDYGLDYVAGPNDDGTGLTIAGQSKRYARGSYVPTAKALRPIICSLIARQKSGELGNVEFTKTEGVTICKPVPRPEDFLEHEIKDNEILRWCEEAMEMTNQPPIVKDSVVMKRIEEEREIKEEQSAKETKSSFPPLRDVQIRALEALQEGKVNRFSLACAVGKTRIGIEAIKKFCREGDALVFVPSLVLVEQWKGWVLAAGMHPICVGSDYDEVEDWRQWKGSERVVALCVYNSWRKVLCDDLRYDLIIVDEAHHVEQDGKKINTSIWRRLCGDAIVSDESEEDESDETSREDDGEERSEEESDEADDSDVDDDLDVVYAPTVLMMSATLDKEEEIGLPVTFSYGIREAINDGIITDYDLLAVYWEQEPTMEQVAEWVKERKQYSSILAYANRVEDAEEFAEACRKLGIKAVSLSCEESVDERMEVIGKFERGEIRVLASVNILGEGVNIDCVDTTLFLQPRWSKRSIVQGVGRALRKCVGKEIAHVVVCCVAGEDGAKSKGVERPLAAVLRALSADDAKIVDAARRGGSRVGMEVRAVFGEDDERREQREEKVRVEVMMKDVGMVINGNWGYWIERLRDFWSREGRWPKCKGGSLGPWLQRQRDSYHGKGRDRRELTPHEIKLLDNIDPTWKDGYTSRLRQDWSCWWEELKLFWEEHRRWPKGQEGKVGRWLQTQKKRYRCAITNMLPLTTEQIALLDSIDSSWKDERKALGFDARISLVYEFKKLNDRYPTRNDKEFRGHNVGKIFSSLQQQARNKTSRPLNQEHYAKLLASFPDIIERKRAETLPIDEFCQQLRNYIVTYNKLPPQNQKPLGRKLQNLRNVYRGTAKDRAKLNMEDVHKIRSVHPNFPELHI